tara:strand:- start:419 stop:1678 length:1260 start_codon:yes stop_codon:yes gene_type:complete
MLDKTIELWYETTDECNKIAAMEIGYKILNSSVYINNKDSLMETLNNELEESQSKIKLLTETNRQEADKREFEFDNKLRLERSKQDELKKDSTHSITIAIENGLKSVERERNTLEEFNTNLIIQNKELYEKLELKTEEFNEIKCSMKTSKTKGEMSEKYIRELIESVGYKTTKSGIHSGDLLVSNKYDELICVLEIKNYGDDNKNKLGPNGSEINKMYNDIKTQIENIGTIPWIFISLGCEIPNIDQLDTTHLGVKCFYLSLPSENELTGYIKCIEVMVEIKRSVESSDNVLMEFKLYEMYNVLNKLSSAKLDFKGINEIIIKLKKKLDKEEEKYNKSIENSVEQSKLIMNNITVNKEFDLTMDIDELKHEQIKSYVKMLQLECFKQISKIKCDICGSEVTDIKKHKTSQKCKKIRDGE